jgi:hypothetical protein
MKEARGSRVDITETRLDQIAISENIGDGAITNAPDRRHV